MSFKVYELTFFLGVIAPEKKHEMLLLLRQHLYHRIGERLPSLSLMRARGMRSNRQCRVKQEHSLLSPPCEISVSWRLTAHITRNFLIDILKRGRDTHIFRHRERKPVRLADAMIGVLAQNNHLHF